MLLILGSVLLGLGIGYALRPRTTRFARPKVRATEWLVVGVVGQVVASRLTGGWAVVIGIAALITLIGFALANLHLTGMGVMIVGLAANLFVMSANGGMPVSPHALVVANVVSEDEVATIDLRGPRRLEEPGDTFRFLGDIIPARKQAVSFGDLIIAVAAADVIANIARRQRRRQPSISTVRPAHDWGIAPSPVPSSASQYSANPDDDAPRTLALATSAPDRHSK